MSLSILGAGAFGTALALTLAQTRQVTLWARDMSSLRHGRSRRLPGMELPPEIRLTDQLTEALQADVILLAVPMQALSRLLARIDDPLRGKALVACCKGMDVASLRGPTAVITHAKPQAIAAILTGPAFAADIARGLPTAMTLACTDPDQASRLQALLSTQSLRLYRSSDTIGAELGGALKNVIAIACGAAIGQQLGDSARAAIMTRGFAEMTRLAGALGGKPQTLAGLSGLGDLSLTCTSAQSRNYRYGIALGQTARFDSGVTVEGVPTAQAANGLADKLGLDLPITRAVADITGRNLPVESAIRSLLRRSLKEE